MITEADINRTRIAQDTGIDQPVISRIFNPDRSETPGSNTLRLVAESLSESMGREVTMEEVFNYLESIGKDFDFFRSKRA